MIIPSEVIWWLQDVPYQGKRLRLQAVESNKTQSMEYTLWLQVDQPPQQPLPIATGRGNSFELAMERLVQSTHLPQHQGFELRLPAGIQKIIESYTPGTNKVLRLWIYNMREKTYANWSVWLEELHDGETIHRGAAHYPNLVQALLHAQEAAKGYARAVERWNERLAHRNSYRAYELKTYE